MINIGFVDFFIAMISETGANIYICGKGTNRCQDEPLHASISSRNPEAVKKAVDKIRNFIKEHVDKVMIPQEENPEINFIGLIIGPRGDTLKCKQRNFFCFELTNDSFYSESTI